MIYSINPPHAGPFNIAVSAAFFRALTKRDLDAPDGAWVTFGDDGLVAFCEGARLGEVSLSEYQACELRTAYETNVGGCAVLRESGRGDSMADAHERKAMEIGMALGMGPGEVLADIEQYSALLRAEYAHG